MNRLYTNKIVIHHSVTPQSWGKQQTVDLILRSHKERGLAYDGNIAYHVLIGKDWEYKGRPEARVGYHAGKWTVNLTSVAICLTGNFNEDKPTKYQSDRLKWHLNRFSELYKTKVVKLHRDIKATACPGSNINKDYIDKLMYNDTNMDYKQKYEEEVAAHKETIKAKELNYQNWQNELDLRKEYQEKYETVYKEWQGCLDRPDGAALQAKIDAIKQILSE